MNRVYKVIWSKAKHCYVVTSEIAKGYGKSAGSKGVKALLSGLVALSIAMGGYGLAGAVFVESKAAPEGVYTTDVYTKTETDDALNGKANTATTLAGYGITDAYTQTEVNGKITAEETARKAADQGNLKINDVGVVSVVKGDSNQDVNKLVLKVDGDNQITMDEKGIKVGTNSTVIGSDGSIKGAAGKFTVDTNGLVTAKGGVDTDGREILTHNGNINAGFGDISGKNISASGNLHADGDISGKDISGKDITGSGTVRGHAVTDGTARMEGGALTGVTTITAGGDVVSTGGKVQGTSVSDGTAILSGGSLNNAVDINASGTITGNNVVVKGKLTTNGLETDRITLGSETLNQTDIYQGNVTSKVNDTVSGVEYTAESIFNKDGSSITARTDVGEHADSTGKSIVGAKEISQYLGDAALPDDSKKNVTRSMVRNGDTFYMEDKAEDKTVDGKNKYSTVSQNAEERKVTVTDGENTASTNLTAADIKNTAENGMISNTAKNLVNTATENMTNTVGKDLTTTVTGDSSLTAENITNEAKNKITNKARDVETDAASSIVQKVTNAAGSNTSTQWSYQTKEEMSQADGKTASYLRGAVEEKSELIDGNVKTTIDTIAGQTNTHITDGTNTSNDLQRADQIASSVTDGTNTTVVNQNAGSLASSITDGTKVNNTNNTVDKSEQLIKVDDTHLYAEIRTAEKAEEALKSGNTVISIVKDTTTATVSSAVTDGATITGVTQTAKDITNTAEKGTIANNAKDITNNATENMTNTVGKDLTTTVGGNETRTVKGTLTETVTGNVTEDYKADLSTKVGGNETHAVTGNQTVTVSKDRTVNVKGTETENFNAQVTNVKTNQQTSVGGKQTNIVGGDQQNTVSGSKTETVNKAVTEKYGSQATTVDGDQSTNVGRNQSNVVKGNQTNTISGSKTESVKGAVSETYGSQNTKVNGDQSTTVTGKQTNSITGDQVNTIGGKQTTTVTGDSSLSAKNITNTASEKITNQIGNGSAVKSEMTAKGITNTAKEGTIYNKSKDILNEASGDIINWADGEIGNVATKITNITGDNTVTSDTNGTTFENKAHSTAVKEGTVTKTTISGNTIETGQATMDYADVTKDLSVGGNATVENDLTVKGASEFVGRADFRYDVYVDNNLTVAKETRTDTLYVDHDGYVGGNLNVDGNIETHDAVLSADSRQVVTGRQLYQTNERVDRLDNRIKKVGANAAALAALRPGDFNPDDKFSIAAGFGSYRNASAAAIGLFYRPNENVLLSLGTSFGDGENMVNAGVSVKFGRGKSMAERRKEMADEVSGMRDEMRSQNERIAELEEMLRKQSELIEKLSKEES